MLHYNKPIYSSESGITLLQMAMILVIISIMMVPFFQIQDLSRKNDLRLTQKIQGADIAESLVQYALKNGRYPLPANPNFSLNNVDSGVEATDMWVDESDRDIGVRTGPSNKCHTNASPNDADLRICADGPTVSGVTQIPFGTNQPGNRVIIGTVPYAVLGLNPAQSLDQFGNRFTYAVTYGLTKASTFNNNKGNIAVRDQAGGALISANNPTTSAHFVVISHGQNRRGAFPGNGGSRESCELTGSTLLSALEKENCDKDSEFKIISNRPDGNTSLTDFFYATNYFIQPGLNVVGGFDDMVEYRTSVNSGNWTSQKIGATTYQTYFSYRKGDDNVLLGTGDMSTIVNARSTLSRGAGQVQVESSTNVKATAVTTDYICSIKSPSNNTVDSNNKARACVKLGYLISVGGAASLGSNEPVNKIAPDGFACSGTPTACQNSNIFDGYNRFMEVAHRGAAGTTAGYMRTTSRGPKDAQIPPSGVVTITTDPITGVPTMGTTCGTTGASGIDPSGRVICD